MRVAAVIPARMGASRFPGKPLAPLLGKPMVQHVYERTAMAEGLETVVVATCDDEIRQVVESFGGRVVMTSPEHERPSSRVAEAAEGLDADVVVMVQGDEPMVHPEMVELAVSPFESDPDVVCSNLVRRIETEDELEDRNTIKVVMDNERFALYFSREPIPTRERLPFAEIEAWKQVCVIPFTAEFLATYLRLPPTPLEIVESIDMVRVLEHGYRVKMVESPFASHAVDTPERPRRGGAPARGRPAPGQVRLTWRLRQASSSAPSTRPGICRGSSRASPRRASATSRRSSSTRARPTRPSRSAASRSTASSRSTAPIHLRLLAEPGCARRAVAAW